MNPKVHYRSHKSPPPVPVLSQLDPVHASIRSSLNSELALYRILTFHVPNLMSYFLCTKISVQAWGLHSDCFTTQFVFRVRSFSTSPNPQTGRPPLVICPGLPIQYIRSYPPYCRQFFQPQTEDALSRSDMVPLITVNL